MKAAAAATATTAVAVRWLRALIIDTPRNLSPATIAGILRVSMERRA